jgi:cellobiose transport system substrate-binding protein
VVISRRNAFRLGLAVAGGLAAASSACGSETADGGGDSLTRLWCWPGGLSGKVLADGAAHFAGVTRLEPSVISGDYKQQLLDVLDRGGEVPRIVGIKGEDVSSLLPRADRFVDLRTLGANEISGDYLPWKWQQGSTFDNRLIGLPIDIGPTAMFYRTDVFRRARLPVEPAAVSAAMRTWDDFLRVGVALKRALPGVSLVASGTQIFGLRVGQAPKRFVDESNRFVGDGAHIRTIWDNAVRLSALGLSARIQSDSDADAWKKAIARGTVAVELGAAWHAPDIEQAAPATAGSWRVAAGPAAGANSGGSFLAIPAGATDPHQAFDVIRWLLSPENQAVAFADAALFPSTPAAYTMPALTGPDEFFGGQRTVEVFGASAKLVRHVYEAPADAAISAVFNAQLMKVESDGKDAESGWHDAVDEGRALARSLGVN